MSAEPAAAPPPSFAAMNLSEPLRRALDEVGYATPTAVQAGTFQLITEGRDVIVQSKTGSGKTAAFAIPLLDRVVTPDRRVQALVLCPTRELALQVAGEFARLGKYRGVATTAIYGGASMTRQIEEIEAGAQVVAGTPGRVLDHLRRGTLDVSGLRAIVLDEADEMLSMGFAEELNAILEFIPKKRQGLLFSATMPEPIQRIALRHLKEPQTVLLSSDSVSPTEVTHFVYFVGVGSRTRELARILNLEKPDAAIIFCNTKEQTQSVAAELQRLGLSAEWLNSDRPQNDRERVLAAFRAGGVKYLVATDVAARGIDVSGVSHVINYGFPESPEQYVHRTGRTGRAGRRGTAIGLITPQDVGNLYFLRLTYGIRPIERSLPSAGEERTRRELDRVKLLREAFSDPPGEDALSLARRLLTHDDSEKIVAWLVAEFFTGASRAAIAQGLQARPAEPEAAPPARELAPAPAPVPPSREPAAPEPAPAARESAGVPPRAEVRGDFRGDTREPRRERGPRRERESRREAPAAPPAAPPASTPEVPAESPAESRAEAPRPETPAPPRRVRTRELTDLRARPAPAERPRRIDVHGVHAGHGEAPAFDDDGPEIGMEEMRVAIGRRDGVRAGDLARLIRERTGLERRDVGRIMMRDRFSLVSIRAEKLASALEALKDAQLNERPLAPERGRGAGASIAPPPEGAEPDSTAAIAASADAETQPEIPSVRQPSSPPESNDR